MVDGNMGHVTAAIVIDSTMKESSGAILHYYYGRSKITEGAREVIRQVAEEFYPLEHAADLETILSKIKDGDKPAISADVMLSPEEVWPYREFTRTKEDNRHSPEEWESMKSTMKEKGWDDRNPLHLMVSEDGDALVVDGNHRLALAKECGVESIPVRLTFVKDLSKADRK